MSIYRGSGGTGTADDVAALNEIADLTNEAEGYKNAAASSATAAASSATAAASSESSVAADAATASSAASTATTAASNASTSETNAASSATAAASSATAAADSATAAATSATNANTAKTEANTAASNAAASETAAATSEGNAATSESNAASSASAAATSATNAAASESSVSTNATNAATSETNAAASETAAAYSATSASSSATSAASSATSAASSATSASTAQTAAEAAQTNAEAAEANAETSANSASTSATNAASSATSASTSATNAATSETNAATSATSAASSATAAAASYDDFDDRYLGAKTSNPSTDNDGDTLVAGALYFDTTNDVMKVYSGSTWVAAYASSGGALINTNNLNDVSSVSSARTNLGLGTGDTPTFNGVDITTTLDVGGAADFADSVTIEGNLTVNGTTTTVNAENLAVADNMIYLREGETTGNVDLGFAGNYNDGTYAHAGFFRDATDGRWKVFDSYTPEPDASPHIDTSHASFNLANVQAGTFVGNLTGDVTGNADTADALSTARTISLSGNVSGSTSFDGSGNVDISVTVADDSHYHIISNVDGLQAALDAKQDILSEGAFADGDKTKLDGIESGATADQTASEILTAIKTVDGSGSGLDADTVDGYHASSFALQYNTNYSGDCNDLKANGFYRIENTATNAPSATYWSAVVTGNGSNVVSQRFTHLTSGETYVRAFNSSWSAWRKVWDSSNMDAPNKSGTSYYQADTWMQFNGGYGIYFPNNNGLHFYPNGISSYGAAATSGSRGNYSGIYDNYSGITYGMFDSSGNGGTYEQGGSGWHYYWNKANGCLGVAASSTSSSYSLYVTGSIYATGNVTAYSDKRLKENIKTIDGALDKVVKLRGVTYNRIDDESKTPQIGVIAQETIEVVPEVVTYAEDVDKYGVSYGNMVGLLIEAIKEQQVQIDELKAALESK